MRIICFADVRLPLIGTVGRELLDTCRALVAHGHEVTMVVRRDVAEPARDPFSVHRLDRDAAIRFECPSESAADLPRAAFLSFVAERAMRRDADALYTRDPGIAARLVNIRRLLRPPVLYDSPGYSPSMAAALPRPPDVERIRALENREAQIWQGADAYVGRSVEVIADLTKRYGRRRCVTVILPGDMPPGQGPDGRPIDYVAERLDASFRNLPR